jgi:hypothetical protein
VTCSRCDACGSGCGRISTPVGLLCRECADSLAADAREFRERVDRLEEDDR